MGPAVRVALAALVPAIAAAAGVLVAGGGDRPSAAAGRAPAGLARAAAVQAGAPARGHSAGPRPAPPRSISIPAAGVKAPVDPVAIRHGALRVPAVGRAGWYDGGTRPGEPGRAVVIGHLDTRTGPGLFARVPELPAGTSVEITDGRGALHRYEVVGGAQVEKDRFPTDLVYGGARGPVLVLVTCGGPYVEGEGYRDNVLVYARAA